MYGEHMIAARILLVGILSMVSASAQLVRQANSSLTLPQTLPPATGYTAENALGSLTFTRPIALRSLRDVTNKLFVVERGGTIQLVDLTGNTKSTFLNLTTYLSGQGTPIYTSSEGGLLSMALHPNYNVNGYFFVFYSFNSTSATSSQLHQRVARLQATGTPGNYNAATTVNTATHTALITQRDEAGNHNGGDLHFGADGYLYISLGDEGAQYDGSDNARRIAKDFLGGIARIDVDLKPGSIPPNAHSQANSTAYPSAITPGTYAVPPDNPYIGLTTWNGYTFAALAVRTEWWSHGFRNPWRMTFDVPTGRLFVADVGQDDWEEISIVTRGANGGWSWREGLSAHTPAVAPTSPPAGWSALSPIYDYPHPGTTSSVTTEFRGNSVTGGIIYRGTRLTELTGRYVFADYVSGRVWSLQDTGAATWTPALLFSEAANVISSFGHDPRNGDVLYTTLTSTGQVKRLVRTFSAGTPPPATLTATGAFSSLASLTPQAGIVAYEPNVGFWSDHALKRRWFSIPSVSGKMIWSADGVWNFPAGQVWIKHFDIDTTRGNPATRRRLETRFLVRNSSGAYGLTYKWRSDNSEADLVGESGLNEAINITDNGSPLTQTWRYPSRTECLTCHNANAGFALGFDTRQLNRLNTFGAQSQNQLAALSGAGYFTGAISAPDTLPALAPLTDTTQSVEWRVRSWLAANCAGCHRPGGSPGNWDARASTLTDAAAIINGVLINTGADAANRFTVPGDAAHSVVLRRLRGDPGYAKMPPLSSSITDQAAVDLITEWIGTLMARPTFTSWQVANFGSSVLLEAAAGADPDKDGVVNEREYLLGTNPMLPSADVVPSGVLGAGQFSVTCPQLPNRSVVLESSTDLSGWSLIDSPENRPLVPSLEGTRTIVLPADMSHRYVRLRVTGP